MVARQAHNLEVDVFKSILRNQENNRPVIHGSFCHLLMMFFQTLFTGVHLFIRTIEYRVICVVFSRFIS